MFSKMYVLSNTDFRCFVNDALDALGYYEITKDNYEEIAASMWDIAIDTSQDVDGFMVVDSYGRWNEISSLESLQYLVYREYKHIIEEED